MKNDQEHCFILAQSQDYWGYKMASDGDYIG